MGHVSEMLLKMLFFKCCSQVFYGITNNPQIRMIYNNIHLLFSPTSVQISWSSSVSACRLGSSQFHVSPSGISGFLEEAVLKANGTKGQMMPRKHI